MTPAFDSAKKRSSAFGIVAAIVPLFGALLGRAVVSGAPSGDAGFPHVILGPFILPVATLLGIGLSVIGIVRGEKHCAIAWVAMILNVALLIYGIARLR